jgi:hypothetical protein
MKKILTSKLKPNKPLIVKQMLELIVAYIAINHHTRVIEVQIDRNIVGDVLLDGNFGTSIIIEKLKVNI